MIFIVPKNLKKKKVFFFTYLISNSNLLKRPRTIQNDAAHIIQMGEFVLFITILLSSLVCLIETLIHLIELKFREMYTELRVCIDP